MRDDDDLLAGYDLSAWEAPPPSAGLADAVVARAKGPSAVAAAEAPGEKPMRRWWIAGGIALVIAAGLALALWGIQRAPGNGEGDVVATRAQQLELGASSAQVDPGTQLHWRRDKHRVTVTQPRGAASWTVAGDDTFVIDAGAMVASVEATGASLRVEVEMNHSDARVIGASAVTAAVVAMVTVIVYEGHVNVTNRGQTVTVEPGTKLELRGPAPPEPPPLVVGVLDQAEVDKVMSPLTASVRSCNAGVDAAKVRANLTVDANGKVAHVELELSDDVDDSDDCMNQVISAARFAPTRSGGTFSYTYEWNAASGPRDATTCDADALREKGQDHLQTGMDAAALAAFEASMKCRPDAGLMRLAFMAACRSKNAAKARFYYPKLPMATTTGIVQICVRNGIQLP